VAGCNSCGLPFTCCRSFVLVTHCCAVVQDAGRLLDNQQMFTPRGRSFSTPAEKSHSMFDACRLDPSGTPARPQWLFGILRLLKNVRLAAQCGPAGIRGNVEDACQPDKPSRVLQQIRPARATRVNAEAFLLFYHIMLPPVINRIQDSHSAQLLLSAAETRPPDMPILRSPWIGDHGPSRQ
jgi:hypothetical protein